MFVSINGVEIPMRRGFSLCIVLALVGRVGGRACEEQYGADQRNELGGFQNILLKCQMCVRSAPGRCHKRQSMNAVHRGYLDLLLPSVRWRAAHAK